VSDGEAAFVGIHTARALVDAARTEYGIDIFLNRDHAHTVDDCKAAIDAGFDSVIFDGVKLPLEENIAQTKEVVDHALRQAQGNQHTVLIEAELGYIGTSSALLNDVPDDVVLDALPTANDAVQFVERTGVHALAPAVGNLHGMLKGRKNPALAIDHIVDIRAALPGTHLVLHGGSGLPDEEFSKAIRAGMNCVHINTEIRVAYRKGIEEALAKDPEQVAPYTYLGSGRDAVREVVLQRLRLFSNMA
jgi:fructose-bisphosphate aldolase class II